MTLNVQGQGVAGELSQRLLELGYDDPKVVEVRRLSGGASRETWSFDLVDHDAPTGQRPMILRRDPPGEPDAENMGREASAIAAAQRHGVPVPGLIDHGDGQSALGTPYLIMERVAGETIPRRILRDAQYEGARENLVTHLGRAAAAIHAIPLAEVPEAPTTDAIDTMWRRYTDSEVPRPVIDLAFRWLKDRRPKPVTPRLVHGDFRLGNVLVDPDGLTAVLDWELVHVGDPMEDLGYLSIRAWRFAGPHPVAGVGSFGDLFDAYVSAGGDAPDPERVRWWQVAGTLTWGVAAITQANRHFRGTTRSVELAAIGRRVAEQEHDLLRMMDEEI